MVRKALPYDAGTGSNVQESDWVLMTQWFMQPGVYLDALGGMQVYADSSGKQVKIHTGEAWAYGTFFYNTDSPDFILGPFPDNPSGNPRIDRVVLRFDWTTNSADFVLLVGTPAGSPTPPATATAPGVVWDLKLAQVNIASGYTTIAAGNVVDERVNAAPRAHDLATAHTGLLSPVQLFSHIGATALNSANLALANNTWTNLTFDTDVFDVYNMHSTSSLTERFVAPGAGRYLAWAYASFAANGTGSRGLALLLGGVGYIAFQMLPTAVTQATSLTVARVVTMSPGDYVYSQAIQDSGGALNVTTGNGGPAAGISWLGPL